MAVKKLTYNVLNIVFVILAGIMLHFAYELSGNNKIVAIIAAVNESVWEHLKLAFWPIIFISVLEFFISGKKNPKIFIISKSANILTVIISITSIFYLYTSIIGYNIVFIDISIFVISVILGRIIEINLYNKNGSKIYSDILYKYSIIIIIMVIAAFSSFTFFPLKNPIFMDPRSYEYGIPE